jgi:alpha-L-fucosidase
VRNVRVFVDDVCVARDKHSSIAAVSPGGKLNKAGVRAKFLCALLGILTASSCAHAQWAPMVADKDAQARIAWWRDAKFGLFMHWGVYSIPGRGEWVQWSEQIPVDEYAKLAGQFNPDKFDPDAWAELANAAGMKYTVLTARHHDGFALFDDPGSSFTAVKSAAHRDFVADYVKAVRKAGLRVGLYYSPLDWRFPGFFFPGIYRANAEEMRAQYHRQLNELASHYGKLDVVWFDGGGGDWLGFGGATFNGSVWNSRPKNQRYAGPFSWQDDEAVNNLRKLQPSVIINDRTDAPADYRSREGDGALGDFENRYPWELCTTLTEGAWGYQPNAKVKSRDYIVRLLVSAVGRDGNFILNVGPRPDGQIDQAQAARLREIGEWMHTYGQSIYATRGGPYLPGDFGVSTYRGKTIYLHILNPAGTTLTLPALPARILACAALTGGEASCKQSDAGVEVTLRGNPSAADTIVEMTLASPAAVIATIRTAVTPKAK